MDKLTGYYDGDHHLQHNPRRWAIGTGRQVLEFKQSKKRFYMDASIARRRLTRTAAATFDTLDFDVYTNQKWDRLKESHAQDILVHYPDGHTTKGIAAHIEELKPMFVFAPDTRIQHHPVKIAQGGDWTSVIGVMEGTFTQPMPIGAGKFIQPTGKAFKLMMSTVGHWKNGVMDEEYLFWDNQGFMKQLGLAH